MFYTIKALSIRQPYADLLAQGVKRYETRNWPIHHRGLILIHSSKGYKPDDRANRDYLVGLGYKQINRVIGGDYRPALGSILAIASVTGCYSTETLKMTEVDNPVELAAGNYRPERFGFQMLIHHVLPEPIPVKGALGVWKWTGTIPGVTREMLVNWQDASKT